MCSAQIGCEQHSLSEQSVIPSGKKGREKHEIWIDGYSILFSAFSRQFSRKKTDAINSVYFSVYYFCNQRTSHYVHNLFALDKTEKEKQKNYRFSQIDRNGDQDKWMCASLAINTCWIDSISFRLISSFYFFSIESSFMSLSSSFSSASFSHCQNGYLQMDKLCIGRSVR